MSGDYAEALRDSFAAPAGTVRVLVVGDSGVGKTSLVHLITEGQPVSRPRVTAGCNVSVKYLEYTASGSHHPGSDASSHRTFFVELWDVTGAPQYHAARSIFYQRINGVIAVHDLTNRRTRSNLRRWASEVASEGTFSAPSPEASYPGGLPVPLLVIGNKSDSRRWDTQTGGHIPLPSSPLKRVASRISSMAGQLEARLSGFSDDESATPLTKKASQWAAKLGGYVNRGQNGGELPRSDSAINGRTTGLLTSARTGKLDMGAVNAFFFELIRRRYFASEMESKHPSAPSLSIFPTLSSGSDLDTRGEAEPTTSNGGHIPRLGSDTNVPYAARESSYPLPPPPGRIRTSASSEQLLVQTNKGQEPPMSIGIPAPSKPTLVRHQSWTREPG